MPPTQNRGKQKVKINTPPVLRPRTRAFVKAHELELRDPIQEDRLSANNPPRSRYLLRSYSKTVTTPLEYRAPRNSPLKGSKETTGPRSVPPSHRAPSAHSGSDRNTSSRREKEIRISLWLTHSNKSFESFSESYEKSPSSSSVLWEVESMQSSSSINTTDTTTTGHEASTRTAGTKKAKITYKQLLEFRGISVKHSPDNTLEQFGLHNITSEVNKHLIVDNIAGLLSVMEKNVKRLKAFMKHGAPENGFKVYQALREDIDEWRPVDDTYRRFPAIPSLYFSLDKEHCMTSSEADFQRTVMMSIIDRYDFKDLFTYSCDEQWTVEPEYLLPTGGTPNKISQPKPDLAISFQRMALTGPNLLPYPINMSKCLSPGNKGDERWFPFLFIEAKKADHSLQHAQERNLHSASQALYNIYQWVRPYDDLTKKFFDEVRVCSIVLNAEDMQLRVHRAERAQKSQLVYKFAQVTTVRGYDQVTAYHLIKSVLIDYARLHLHPVLKDAFIRVAKNELRDGLAKKRKKPDSAADIQPGAAEMVPDSPVPEVSQTSDAATGLSFGTAVMELSGQPRKRGKVGTRPGK